MRERGITDVYVTGLARDVCVKWTAEDAADLGFATTVIWDLTRPVNPASDARVRSALARRRSDRRIRVWKSQEVLVCRCATTLRERTIKGALSV